MKLIPVEMEVDRYHLSYFKKVFEVAKEKFILWKKRDKQYKLRGFISYCLRYEPEQSEGLSLEYYTDNGGYVTNSHFLFGKASQFRGISGKKFSHQKFIPSEVPI
jgi:hypothetical protein